MSAAIDSGGGGDRLFCPARSNGIAEGVVGSVGTTSRISVHEMVNQSGTAVLVQDAESKKKKYGNKGMGATEGGNFDRIGL